MFIYLWIIMWINMKLTNIRVVRLVVMTDTMFKDTALSHIVMMLSQGI